MFNGKTYYKWPFSIAMLNYQRVYDVCVEEFDGRHHGKDPNK